MTHRDDARAIWDAAVAAARPGPLIEHFFARDPLATAIRTAPRVVVIGAGKAGSTMAEALEAALPNRVEGVVNVPAGMDRVLPRIRLHAARPQGVNEPTAAGVLGAEQMVKLLAEAGADDVAVCLLSGGGSALLPAPAEGIALEDKLAVTKLLHRSGATIDEMNCVRKHLSRAKGGRLAEAFRGRLLVSLIISDVVGDPLDVIASGPTAPDPTTFAEAVQILKRFGLWDQVPTVVRNHLQRTSHETPKTIPANVVNRVIGSNRVSLDAAAAEAGRRGYRVLDLGSFVEGDTTQVATAAAGIVRSIRRDAKPLAPPACILIGGETTVSLGAGSGKGGRNQEFVLAMLAKLGRAEMNGVTILSGGTDGEDGPTDAAGAVADSGTFARTALSIQDHLLRHDAYPYFDSTGDLIRCGLTGTNVMDVRVVLVN
jgi:hydroxypyruvate reductase/glycerate 2-kinase